jgi:hypothetical protein
VQDVTFCVVLKPPLHALHSRFADFVPALLTYWPAAQLDQVEQRVAFSVSLNVPDEHEEHVRSVLVEPG